MTILGREDFSSGFPPAKILLVGSEVEALGESRADIGLPPGGFGGDPFSDLGDVGLG